MVENLFLLISGKRLDQNRKQWGTGGRGCAEEKTKQRTMVRARIGNN